MLAAATHLVFSDSPAIGASGAINGIVGMFLIFFWENEVDCIWLFFPVIRQFTISSYWIIGLWLVYDIAGAAMGGGGVGYFAHLGGFFAGVAMAVILLKLNLVTMCHDEESLVSRFEQWLQDRRDTQLEKAAQVSVKKAKEECPPRPVSAVPLSAMVRFQCSCGKQIKVPLEYGGKKGRCPQCRQELVVPRSEVLNNSGLTI